jgi:hypothetical protein
MEHIRSMKFSDIVTLIGIFANFFNPKIASPDIRQYARCQQECHLNSLTCSATTSHNWCIMGRFVGGTETNECQTNLSTCLVRCAIEFREPDASTTH